MSAQRLGDVAAELAEGRVSSRQLTERATRPDDLGATERILAAEAAAAAGAADARRASGTALGPLDGIPFAVKANIDIAGVPTTSGAGLTVPRAAHDSAAVRRLRAAGLIPVRTATMAELAIGSVTDNPHTGPCRNPGAPRLNAGGSSGGSAALVAAGVVPLALGSDTMGSVRIPAAYCQIAGWKPTRGLVDADGLVPLHPYLDTVGLLAATAADLLPAAALVLEDGAAAVPFAGERPVVAVPSIAAVADDAAARALEAARHALDAHDVPVGELRLDLDLARLRRRGLLACEAHTYRRFAAAVDGEDAGLSPRVRDLLRYGRDAGGQRVAEAEAALRDAAADVARQLAGVDVLILPATPAGPPPLGSEPPGAADLTAWVNVAGLPAVVVPAGAPDDDGLRRAVQLVGRPSTDLALLRFAGAIERTW